MGEEHAFGQPLVHLDRALESHSSRRLDGRICNRLGKRLFLSWCSPSTLCLGFVGWRIPSICADCAPSRKGASRSHGKTGVPGCGRKEDAGTIRNLLAAAEAADSKKERREIFPMTKLRRKKLACRVYGRGRVGGSSCPSPYTGNSTQSSTAQRPLG